LGLHPIFDSKLEDENEAEGDQKKFEEDVARRKRATAIRNQYQISQIIRDENQKPQEYYLCNIFCRYDSSLLQQILSPSNFSRIRVLDNDTYNWRLPEWDL